MVDNVEYVREKKATFKILSLCSNEKICSKMYHHSKVAFKLYGYLY